MLKDPSYKNSLYNVEVEWETMEITFEPLSVVAVDDPVSCALYAKENDLLDKPGWKRFRNIAKNQKKLTRLIRQAKLRTMKTAIIYQYGYKVPRNYEQAMQFDKENGKMKWHDSEIWIFCR